MNEIKGIVNYLQFKVKRYKSLINATEINIKFEKEKLNNRYRDPNYLWMMREELKHYIEMLKVYKTSL